MMAPLKQTVTVVGALLPPFCGTGEVQLADQAAFIPGILKQLGHQNLMIREMGIAIAMNVVAGGILAGQKGRAAGCANGALDICIFEGHATFNEAVDIGCRNVWIAQAGNRVIALLIRAIPKYVGRSHLQEMLTVCVSLFDKALVS